MKLTLISTCMLLGISFLSGCSKPVNQGQSDQVKTASGNNSKSSLSLATVEVHNSSDFARPHQTIYLSYRELGLAPEIETTLALKVGEQTLASEAVDIDLDSQLDGVLFTIPLEAAEHRLVEITEVAEKATLKKRTQAEVSIKQNGQWQPHQRYPNSQFKEYVGGEFVNVDEVSPAAHYTDHSNWIRYEGPGIESDKVAYRIYLDHRNGFDVFGKKTNEMMLQKVGIDGYQSYHEMQDWGMDILKVGKSLGAGGYGLWYNEQVYPVADVAQRHARILSNGALFSGFNIHYSNWQNPLGSMDLNVDFTMQAGSRLVNVALDLNKQIKQMAVGIVKHPDTELISGDMDITGKAWTYLASWGAQALDNGQLGMAIFFQRSALDKLTQDDNNYLAILSPEILDETDNGRAQLNYAFAAVWDKESNIQSKEAFVDYLDKTVEKLTAPPRLRLKTTMAKALKSQVPATEQPLSWSQKLADSELTRKAYTYRYDGWDVNRKRAPKFEYDIVGLYPFSLHQLAKATQNPQYSEALRQITASFITADGNIKRYKQKNYNIDSVAPGRAVLALYKETGDEKFRKAADILREQLKQHPKTTEGAFWHKQKYPHQLWLDGVYMGMPFLAEYSLLFENGASLEEVVKEFILTEKYLKDSDTGLYYHAWDEAKQQNWASPETGLSPEFWARGMGWLAMALVDVLELLPEQKTALREPLITMSQDFAEALVKSQDSTGSWWQVMDKPGATGNYRESSATAMFAYFLAKSVANGYIGPEYKTVAFKAYEGLINEFVTVQANGQINMTNQCYVAGLGFGRDGSYEYYMSEPVWENDPKGTGPFILAGIAMQQMLTMDKYH